MKFMLFALLTCLVSCQSAPVAHSEAASSVSPSSVAPNAESANDALVAAIETLSQRIEALAQQIDSNTTAIREATPKPVDPQVAELETRRARLLRDHRKMLDLYNEDSFEIRNILSRIERTEADLARARTASTGANR